MNSQPLTSQTASGEQRPRLPAATSLILVLSFILPNAPSVVCLQGEEEGEGAGRAVEEAGGLGAEAGP